MILLELEVDFVQLLIGLDQPRSLLFALDEPLVDLLVVGLDSLEVLLELLILVLLHLELVLDRLDGA